MKSYKEEAYRYLKDKIIRCEYKPGDILDLNEIQVALNISRTPIRDAISALEQENLVVVLPRRGILVATISPRDIADLYVVREALEPVIARSATFKADPNVLQEYKKKFLDPSQSITDLNHLDYNFHHYLLELTNNSYISSVMESVLANNMRFIILGSQLPNRMQVSNDEHTAIIDAMIARDIDRAEEAMRAHITEAHNSAIATMALSI